MLVKRSAVSMWTYTRWYCMLSLLVVGLLSSQGQEHVDHGAYSPKLSSSDNAVDRTGILGTKATDPHWQNLDADTAKTRLRELVVNGIDADHDGFVSADELRTWIHKNFRDTNYDTARERFQDADTDNSAKVSWAEHLSEAWGMDDDDNELLHPADYADDRLLIKEDRMLFDAAATNNSDQLTFDEYFKFLYPQEHPEMLPFITQNALKARDKDNDGKISWFEYIRDVVPLDVRTKEEEELYQTEKSHFDEVYDTDHDGYLSGNEIYAWLVPDDSSGAAEFETKHLMEKSDTNKDGRLSIDEILANIKHFLGSDATQRGEQLQHHDAEEL